MLKPPLQLDKAGHECTTPHAAGLAAFGPQLFWKVEHNQDNTQEDYAQIIDSSTLSKSRNIGVATANETLWLVGSTECVCETVSTAAGGSSGGGECTPDQTQSA